MNNLTLVEAMRDFFHSGTAEGMKNAYAVISGIAETGKTAENVDWEQEEFVFNRLFVGPAAPKAPKVASVYLEPEGHIQGDITKSVRNFYESVGLSLQVPGQEPEDALEYELDACRYLMLMADEVRDATDACNVFIAEHMSRWIPEFTRRAIDGCGDSAAVRDVLIVLDNWIKSETEAAEKPKEQS